MVISQGELWWTVFPQPTGSAAAHRRPAVIVQGDAFNAGRISTTIVVPCTTNLRLVAAPGNVLLRGADTGLPRDSVANVSLVMAIDRTQLDERVGRLRAPLLASIFAGIDVVLGRE